MNARANKFINRSGITDRAHSELLSGKKERSRILFVMYLLHRYSPKKVEGQKSHPKVMPYSPGPKQWPPGEMNMEGSLGSSR